MSIAVQIGERVDHRGADPPAEIRMIDQRRWLLGSHHEPAPPLHQIEYGAQHADILAQEVRARRQRKDRMQRGEPAILAGHVVRRRRAPGRAAHAAAPAHRRR